jgi:hypothetical protein
MDEGLRYSSSRETAVGSSEERTKSEEAVEQGLFDSSLGASHSPASSGHFSGLVTSFRTRSPRLYGAVTRVLIWVRGPRPKLDLPSKFLYPG